MARTGTAKNFVKISITATVEMADNSLKALAGLSVKLDSGIRVIAEALEIPAGSIGVDAKPIRAKAA